jgi:hypothetical protein
MPSADQTPFSHLTWLDLDAAAPTPGIYAWYSAPVFGDHDSENEDGVRLTLARHSEHYLPPPLSIEARSRFWDAWSGHLSHREDERSSEAEALTEVIQRCLATDTARAHVLRLLSCARPALQSPLYIGIGINLRDRLLGHKRAYRRLQRESEANRRILATDPHADEATKFAERVLVAGFRPDELTVWCLDLQRALGIELPKNRATRDLLETVEWFLNRWARPMLGRG